MFLNKGNGNVRNIWNYDIGQVLDTWRVRTDIMIIYFMIFIDAHKGGRDCWVRV